MPTLWLLWNGVLYLSRAGADSREPGQPHHLATPDRKPVSNLLFMHVCICGYNKCLLSLNVAVLCMFAHFSQFQLTPHKVGYLIAGVHHTVELKVGADEVQGVDFGSRKGWNLEEVS